MKGECDMAEYGVITEQGDLGLGFNPLNPSDQQVYQEAVNKQHGVPDSATVINEGNKENK